MGVDYVLNKDAPDRSAFINEIDLIIKSSEELGHLLGGVSGGGKLYDKVLSDQDLVKKIRAAKNKGEVEKILNKWSEKNYPELKKMQEESPQEGEGGKLLKAKKKLEKAIKDSGEKLKSKLSSANKEKKLAGEKGGEGEEKNEIKDSKLSPEAQKAFTEVKMLLETKNIDRLIDILNNLKDEQIKELLDHYHKSLENDKLTIILKKADTPQDVINLLKSETINALKDEYERIKVLIGQARRKGKNVNAEWLEIMSMPSKIKMFAATFKKKDFLKVRETMLEIERKVTFMIKGDTITDNKKEEEPKQEPAKEEASKPQAFPDKEKLPVKTLKIKERKTSLPKNIKAKKKIVKNKSK